VNQCGDGAVYKGIEAHLKHVVEKCQRAKVICKRCRLKCELKDFKAHNCAVGLINQVETNNVATLKAALSEMQN
jgi:hypothetical protein